MSNPAGCAIETLAHQECIALIAWAQGKGRPLSWAQGVRWLLAHCDDGVVWGRLDPGSTWLLSCDAFPRESPRLREVTLQQMRVFGPVGEALLWRADSGFLGRWAIDDLSHVSDALKPKDDTYVLLGDRLLGANNGFSLVGDATGSRHAAPIECGKADFGSREQPRYPLCLKARHYLEEDPDTGAVRICMTRLVDLVNISAGRAS